ncbi:MAG: hypothetical protein ABI203_11625, partial [Mucilaginibacter sp.]
MKKILLVCCFLIGIAAVSHAQSGVDKAAEARAKKLQTVLGLNDSQETAITAIYKAQRHSLDSLRIAVKGNRQLMIKGIKPLTIQTNAKIKAVLTADQATAYDKMMKKRM